MDNKRMRWPHNNNTWQTYQLIYIIYTSVLSPNSRDVERFTSILCKPSARFGPNTITKFSEAESHDKYFSTNSAVV